MNKALKSSTSNDPEDVKWDHWREDSLLHVFHSLMHKVWDAARKDNLQSYILSITKEYSVRKENLARHNEQFFYSHQQMMRRANIEREAQGMERIKPLTPAAMREPLGPGYRGGEGW